MGTTSIAKPEPGGALHKIFLGYAPGTGKTFAMLDEAHRRVSRGQKLAIAATDTYGRKATEDQLAGFSVIPAIEIKSENGVAHELNLPLILEQKPELVVIDDLAHMNPPGMKNASRWEDVKDILAAGISVLSTLNVYHLESLNDKIAQLVGVRVRETVPDTILHSAHEIEMIDVTPQALMNRLNRGDVFPQGYEYAYKGIFTEERLTALRELALREAMGRIDEDVEELRREKEDFIRPWQVAERVMICMGPSTSSMRLIRRGWRIAQKMHGSVYAVYVQERPMSADEAKILEEDKKLAERLGVEVIELSGRVSDRLIEFARENAITQIILGHSTRSPLQQRFKRSLITELAEELKTIDILVVAGEKESS